MTDILAYWPILLALLGLAVAWGAALTKISDLKQRVTDLEQTQGAERERVAAKLEALGEGLARIEGILTRERTG